MSYVVTYGSVFYQCVLSLKGMYCLGIFTLVAVSLLETICVSFLMHVAARGGWRAVMSSVTSPMQDTPAYDGQQGGAESQPTTTITITKTTTLTAHQQFIC